MQSSNKFDFYENEQIYITFRSLEKHLIIGAKYRIK